MQKTTFSDGVKRYRCFKVKFVSPTNFRPARISISDERGIKPSARIDGKNKRLTKIISFDHSQNNSADIALNYLESIGIPITGFSWSEVDQCDYLLTENFETELK